MSGPGSWNWGDVPTWIGSIITSVSLLLAFMILRSDHRSKARALADGFVVWPEFVHDLAHDRWLMRVNWTNTGGAPILQPYVMERVEGRLIPRGFLGEREGVTATVKPGASGGKALHHLAKEPKDVYVEFADGHGRLWWRDLITGQYFSRRKMRRWIVRSRKVSKGKPVYAMPGVLPAGAQQPSQSSSSNEANLPSD